MVITDKFVYIHKPKTGGTFVTDALINLYGGKWNQLTHLKLALLSRITYNNPTLGKLTLTSDKHGGCLGIPGAEASKSVISTIRNPLDYYVSQYEFGWWKHKKWLKYYKTIPDFRNKFSSFPDVSFRQFLELYHTFNPLESRDFSNNEVPGRCTYEFIDMYFKEPSKVYRKMSPAYFESGDFKKDMFPVDFIFTNKLNKQLHAVLLKFGYPEDQISFILEKKKVLPQGKGRSENQKWPNYYTPDLIDLIRKKDYFLFLLFPSFADDLSN